MPLAGDLLTDHIGNTGGEFFAYFFLRKGPAMPVVAAEAILIVEGVQPLLGTEAPIGVTGIQQKLSILCIESPALGLDVGADRAPQVRALIPVEATFAQCGVNDLGGAFHQAFLVGILNTENELAAAVAGDEPGVKGGAQIAHVHIAGGRGGKPGADLPLWDLGLHLLKILHIQSHVVPSIAADVLPLFYWYYRCFPAIWQGPERSPAPLLPSPARRGGPLFLFLAEKQFWKCSLQNSQAAAALIG